MTCAVVAVQGAFIEQEERLAALGEEAFEVRQPVDLKRHFDRLVLPGGESTTQSKLLKETGLFDPLRAVILDGAPVLGVCAGLILLAQAVDGRGDLRQPTIAEPDRDSNPEQMGTLPVSVVRNGYGRQLGSFKTFAPFDGRGAIPMTFIRAPRIAQLCSEEMRILAEVGGTPVAVRYQNQLGVAFHPELDDDSFVLEYFLSM
ncbi:pyridoxal 5'-phosphate synthase glutaminase subunit PdxT [Eggerthellaceae bacterium zg-997]|nr:pyridoxal 5'-phosphate synthase glutaminase subunit PdxT [Eggerthellaceae bacterium zg-997]